MWQLRPPLPRRGRAVLLAAPAYLWTAGQAPEAAAGDQPAPRLELCPGDHVCLIGNNACP
jgi:hypothetical protein